MVKVLLPFKILLTDAIFGATAAISKIIR